LRSIVQTNGCDLGIGAHANTYRARSGRGTCSIMLAKNLNSSMLHIKYLSLSSWHIVTNISCN